MFLGQRSTLSKKHYNFVQQICAGSPNLRRALLNLILFWGGAEEFFPGAVEGGVVVEAAFVACLGGGHSSGDILSGEKQALCSDVGSHASAGFFFEGMHQIIFADKKSICQHVCGEFFRQMCVDIIETFQNLGVGGACFQKLRAV